MCSTQKTDSCVVHEVATTLMLLTIMQHKKDGWHAMHEIAKAHMQYMKVDSCAAHGMSQVNCD